MTGDGERVSGMAKKASSSRNVLKARFALLQHPREADTDERVAGDGERALGGGKKASSSRNVLKARFALLQSPREADTDERVAGDGERAAGGGKKTSSSRNVLKARLALRPPFHTGPACTPWWTQSGGRERLALWLVC